MIDKTRLQEALIQYKEAFLPSQWKNEKYKWEAIKHFQDNWDINADDFPAMLKNSLDKTFNLLASQNHFPGRMMVELASNLPEDVRAMYMALFDESQDLFERISNYKSAAADLLVKAGKSELSHFQDENAIATYLWLRFPDKYYIYKYGEVKAVAEEIGSSYSFKKGAYSENLRSFYKLYDEMCEVIRQDKELVDMLRGQLTESCYSDPECRTLTIDVGFYISRNIAKKGDQVSSDEWWPSIEDYSPGISKEEWVSLLNNPEIIGPIWGNSLAEFYDIGGEATCTQVGKKYHRSPYSVSGNITNFAKALHKHIQCPLVEVGDGSKRYWPILFFGKNAESSDEGSYIWKLRPELFEALKEVNITKYLGSKGSEDATAERNYWWLTANPKIWSFNDLAVGDMQSYSLFNENGNKRRIFQNFLDAKEGDIFIGYESNPIKQVVALGKVSAEQDGEKIFFEKTEGLTSPIDYQALRELPELSDMEFFVNPNGSLFKLSQNEYELIMNVVREENPVKVENALDSYTKDDFLSEVYMTESKYNTLVAVLRNKKNIILQGAPGVGKTYTAKRLAYSMMKEKDNDRIEFVQFHQNYSYEDFMMGYKPVEDGFELKYGIFYRFCQKAANHPEKDYFFIIDEINRGNLSKIFGELLMLIEKDYRGTKATLAYNGLSFSVPENLYIIGMMNTADRSLAMIDYALRRRFSFIEMEPGFDSEGFIQYQKDFNNDTFDELISKIKELNWEIAKDKSLGKGFCIGHSYFCQKDVCTEAWMKEVVDYEVIPMLEEYWFDEPDKLQKWENILHGVFQ